MFPFSEPQKQFSIAILEIDLQRHQGHSGPFGVLVQLLDLLFMKKELATTIWVLVPDIAFLIRGNVDIAKPNFAIFNLRKAIFQVNACCTDTFDLCPRQHHPCFNRIHDGVVMSRLFILRDYLSFALCHVWLLSLLLPCKMVSSLFSFWI